MASSQLLIGGYRKSPRLFTPAHAARAFVLWRPATLGSRIHAISASNSDTTNPVPFNLAWGRIIFSTIASTAVATISGNNTLTLTGGDSFIAPSTAAGGDKCMAEFLGGEKLAILDATSVNNRGAMGRITAAPTATSLVFPASTFAVNEALPPTGRIALVAQAATVNIRAGAGYAAGVSPTNLLSQSVMEQLYAQPDNTDVYDPNTVLLGWCNATLAAGKYVDVTVHGGDY